MIEYGKARVGARAEVERLTNTSEDAPHLARHRPQVEPLTFRSFYIIIGAALVKLPGWRMLQRSVLCTNPIDLAPQIANEDDLIALLMAAAPSPAVARTTASKIWIRFEMARRSVAELRQEGSHD